MKKLQNEQGYALLVTLGVIILITLFLTSFQVIAVNNAKQIQISDETYEVTSIAEMGVEYYEGGATYIVGQYMDTSTEKGKLTKKAVEDINNYINNQKGKPVDQSIIDNHKKILIENILKDINDFFKTTPNDVFYKLVKVQEVDKKYALQPKHHKWLFTVEGKTPNSSRTQKIAAELSLENFEIIVKAPPVENGGEQSIIMPEQKFATENRTNLSTGSFLGNDFNVGYLNNPTNAKISALGNVRITGMNNMNIMEIIANGNVKIDNPTDFTNFNLSAASVEFNHLNNIIKSNINVYGNAKIETLNGFSDSKVFINGDLSVNNKIAINDSKSSVIVNGTLILSQLNTEIFSGTVVVDEIQFTLSPNKESIKVQGTGNIPAKLCIKDIGNIGILKNQAVKATGQGKIIFWDKNLDFNSPLIKIDGNKYKDINPDDLTGNHSYVAGLNEFNKECGITTALSQTELYQIQDQPIKGLDKVKYID